MPYYPRKKWLSQDPEKRDNQMQNLVQNRMKRYKKPEIGPVGFDDPEYETNIIKFAEEQFYIPETNSPIVLEDWQKKEIMVPLFYGGREYTMGKIIVARTQIIIRKYNIHSASGEPVIK